MTTHTAPKVADRYTAASVPLTALIDAVPAEKWLAPSPCDDWTAADVVRHLIETERDFLTKHGADLGDQPDVDGNPSAAWRAHSVRVLDLLSDDALVDTEFDGYFGPTTVGAAFGQVYLFDVIVHRWDIAEAAALDTTLTTQELDEIETALAGFGDAIYMEGICKPGVEVAADTDRATRLLAKLGRQAGSGQR